MKIMGRIMVIQQALVCPPFLLLLTVVCFWALSTLLPFSLVHIYIISGLRLNVCCISASNTTLHALVEDSRRFDDAPPQSRTSTANGLLSGNNKSDEIHAIQNWSFEEDRGYAYTEVKRQIEAIISASMPNTAARQASCEGRKIYVYNLPPKFNLDLVKQCDSMVPWLNLCNSFTNDGMGKPIKSFYRNWYQTHQYALELIFHARMLRNPCQVSKPEEALLYYIPYYGALDVLRWHFRQNVSLEKIDELGVELLNWLQGQHWWRRKGGKDHLLVVGTISWDLRRVRKRDPWGSKLLEIPQMQAPTKLLIERNPWQINDIGVPYPTFFHPHSDEEIRQWQARINTSERPNLISFAGAPRPNMRENIRSILIDQCVQRPEACKFLDCNSGVCDRPESTVKLFMASEFCLQPPGDSPTRRSVFDSLVAGCIPVMFDPFTAYYQYPWHLPANASSYSVFMPQENVRDRKVDIVEALRKIPQDQRQAMRRTIVHNIMPGLVYGDPDSKFSEFEDAFTISLNNLMWKIENSIAM